MTRTSIIALTALALAFASPAAAQVNVNSTVQGTTDAAGSVTGQAAGGTVSTTGGVSVDAAASGSADANNDGSITAEEQATFDANVAAGATVQTPDVSVGGSGNANVPAIVTADANNDGTITDEERQAAATAAGAIALELACADAATALNGSGALDAAPLAMVAKVVVVEVSDCSEPPAGSVSAEAASSAISGNTMIMNEINMQLGGGMPGILGATLSGDTLTVYVNES